MGQVLTCIIVSLAVPLYRYKPPTMYFFITAYIGMYRPIGRQNVGRKPNGISNRIAPDATKFPSQEPSLLDSLPIPLHPRIDSSQEKRPHQLDIARSSYRTEVSSVMKLTLRLAIARNIRCHNHTPGNVQLFFDQWKDKVYHYMHQGHCLVEVMHECGTSIVP